MISKRYQEIVSGAIMDEVLRVTDQHVPMATVDVRALTDLELGDALSIRLSWVYSD